MIAINFEAKYKYNNGGSGAEFMVDRVNANTVYLFKVGNPEHTLIVDLDIFNEKFTKVEEEQVFKPITKYLIINEGGTKIIGYSERSREDLHKFVQSAQGAGFFAKGEDGKPVALLRPQFILESTFVYTDIAKNI